MSRYSNAARNYEFQDSSEGDYDLQPGKRPAGTTAAYRNGAGAERSFRPAMMDQTTPAVSATLPRRAMSAANIPPARPAASYIHSTSGAGAAAYPGRRASGRQANEQFTGSNMKIALVGLGIVLLLVVSYWLVSFALYTWQTWQDDLTYGRPRITRLEANVGHNESGGNKTIFFAQNIKGQISITEFPGGDPSKIRVIVGPNLFGKDKDLVPIKLQVKDLNSDGQNDLIASADDQQLVYINENGNFRPINEQERARLRTMDKGETK